jgi:hypothetical protein
MKKGAWKVKPDTFFIDEMGDSYIIEKAWVKRP